MERLWSQTIESVRSTVATALPPLLAWWEGLGPERWALAALPLLLLLWSRLGARRRRRRRRAPVGALPELLMSRGEIRLLELVDTLPGAGDATEPQREHAAPDDRFALAVTLSNLGGEPVQLLELAVRTELAQGPALLERDALIPPRKSVTLEGQVTGLAGDRGWIEVYLVAGRRQPAERVGRARSRSYRLRARLVWEPWRERYRVEPLEQRVEVARALPSSQLAARDRHAWRQRQLQLRERERVAASPNSEAAEGAEIARAESQAAAALLARRRGFAAAGPDNGATVQGAARTESDGETRERVDLQRLGTGPAGGLGGGLAGGRGGSGAVGGDGERAREAAPAELVIEPLLPSPPPSPPSSPSSLRLRGAPQAAAPESAAELAPAETPVDGGPRESGAGVRGADAAGRAPGDDAGRGRDAHGVDPRRPAGRDRPDAPAAEARAGTGGGGRDGAGDGAGEDAGTADRNVARNVVRGAPGARPARPYADLDADRDTDAGAEFDVEPEPRSDPESDPASESTPESDGLPPPRHGRLEFPDEF